MTVTTVNPANVAEDTGLGSWPWTNIGNAAGACDATDATSTRTASQQVRGAYGSQLGLSLPSNAIISDIAVTLRLTADVINSFSPMVCWFKKAIGGTFGTERSASFGGSFPASAGVYVDRTANGTLAFWGINAWTISELNASTFGFDAAFICDANGTIGLDCMTIAVTYTVPGPIRRGLVHVGF